MPKTVTITARRLRALERAEKTCQQLRADIVAMGGAGQATQKTLRWLFAWKRLAGKAFYHVPPPAPLEFPDRPQDARVRYEQSIYKENPARNAT